MELVIETGQIGDEWRAAARAGDELVAEARGKDEAAARSALSRMIGERSLVARVDPENPVSLTSSAPRISGNALRDAITELLRSHPELRPEDRCSASTKYMGRYRTLRGRGLAHEHSHSVQHLWVAAEGLPAALGNISQKAYPGGRDGDGRHSNLKPIPDLVNADLVRFSPRDLAEACRIIDAIAPLPPTADNERKQTNG